LMVVTVPAAGGGEAVGEAVGRSISFVGRMS